jgi:TatD DNase family protein
MIFSGAGVYGLIDTHAHLDEIDNLELALISARKAGVKAIVAVGQDLNSNEKNLQLADKYRGFVYAAVGLHPWALAYMGDEQIEENIDFIAENLNKATALGEVGLDYHKKIIKETGKDRQQQVLIRLLQFARRYDKPVSIHSRYAWKDCLHLVKEVGIRKVAFHWYTGFSSTLSEILQSGYFISATPAAEYHDEHRRAIKEAPVEQLLLETDCPVEYGRSERYHAEPADVLRSLKAVASIKGLDEEYIAECTTKNARRLFKV